MEAYRIDRFGSVYGIVLRSSEDPRPGPKEILMRVRASSLRIQFTFRLVIPTTRASSASCGPRPGRNPYESPRNSSSYMALSTMAVAPWT